MSLKAGLHIIPHDKDLLVTLSKELCSLNEKELKNTLVVLPTQRLGQYLLAHLSKQKASHSYPKVTTLEKLIEEFFPHSKTHVRLISSTEELLLGSLLRQKNYRHLQKGHEHEIREFFSQMDQHCFQETLFRKIQSHIQKDIYRDESHTGSLIDRIDELSSLYLEYKRHLHEKNLTSTEQYYIQGSERLMELWKPSDSIPWHAAFFACFTTVKRYYRPLFKMLTEKNNVRLLFSQAPKLLGRKSPLLELQEFLLNTSLTILETEAPLKVNQAQILQCTSLYTEVEEAIRTVESFIKKGVPESQIGLLLTHEKTYSKLLVSKLKKRSFKCNLAIAQDFSQSLLGSWLIQLFDYLSCRKDTDKKSLKNSNFLLSDLISHPWTLQNQETLKEDLSELLYDLSSSKEFETLQASYLEFSKKLENIQKLLSKQSRESVKTWYDYLNKLFEQFGLSQEKIEGKVTKSEEEALLSFYEFFKQWTLCWDGKISAQECFSTLKQYILNLEVRSIGFPHRGVQVLDLIEARYVPFDVLIILGCIEGNFPRALPNDRLVGEALKVQIGMPGWAYMESLEDTTFHLLCRQAKNFCFIYSQSADHVSSPSRFLSSPTLIQAEKKFSCDLECSQEPTYEATPADDKVAPPLLGAYNGDRKSLWETVSASSLTQVFRCPYQFLLSQLQVRAETEDSPSLWEGRWLHEILEGFYTGYLEKKKILDPLPQKLSLKFDEIIPFAMERLLTLTDLCLPQSVKNSPFHLHVQHFAWPRFAQHWSKFFTEASDNLWVFETKLSLKEYSLNGRGLPLGDKEWTSILGSLDSIDKHPDLTVLVDYKRKHLDTVSDVAKGLAPQLPLYALALAQNRFEQDEEFLDHCLVGYWNLTEGHWQARGVGKKIRENAIRKKLANPQTPLLEDLIGNLQGLWRKTLDELLIQNRNFTPTPNEACEYCPFTGICRTEDEIQE